MQNTKLVAMKIKLYSILFLQFFSLVNLLAQEIALNWAKSIGGIGGDSGLSIATLITFLIVEYFSFWNEISTTNTPQGLFN